MTTIQTRQLTTIYTRQLTTIHTRQLTTIHTRQLTTINTTHLTIQHVQTVNSTTVRKYSIQFPALPPTHTVLTLSPQPFTSHHFNTHIIISYKVSFIPRSLHYTSLHFTSFHFTTLSDDVCVCICMYVCMTSKIWISK